MSQRPAGLSGEWVARARELFWHRSKAPTPKQPIQGSYTQTTDPRLLRRNNWSKKWRRTKPN